MTVAGESTVPGAFTLVTDVGSCGGGAGGGLARSGTGLVVDFVATVARSGGGGGGGSAGTTGGTTEQGQTSTVEVAIGNGVDAMLSADNIAIQFDSVIEQGTITARELSPEELSSGSFIEVKENGNGLISIESSIFETFGSIYDLQVSHTLRYDGGVTLSIPYNENALTQFGFKEEDLRLVHYTNGQWEDPTISVDARNDMVTAELTSLSPVAVAVVNDGTFGQAYFEKNPISRLSVGGFEIIDGNVSTSEVAKGQEIAFAFELSNNQREARSYTYIVQVFSSAGIVESISLNSGSVERGESAMLSMEWIPDDAQTLGTHDVKILIVSSLDDPQLLAKMSTLKMELISH